MPVEVYHDKRDGVYWFGISEMDMPEVVSVLSSNEKYNLNFCFQVGLNFQVLSEIRPAVLEKVDFSKDGMEKISEGKE